MRWLCKGTKTRLSLVKNILFALIFLRIDFTVSRKLTDSSPHALPLFGK